jgi:apolipoprotein N-acyltransferase
MLAAAVGVAGAGRWRVATALAAVLVGLGALLPPVPERPIEPLLGVGAVHMPTLSERPGRSPDGVKLLVWPEQVAIRRPWLVEGDAQPTVVRPPTMRAGVRHLYGALIRTPEGHMNAIASLEPSGRVQAVRAKRRLFPLVETPFLGVMAPGVKAMVPGRRAPWLRVDAECVGTLVCVEAFDRALVGEARAAGARWLAISANDELLNNHPAGHRQMLGTAVLRAVESGLPVVRASVFGRASIVGGDGRVLAWSEPGRAGVLKLPAATVGQAAARPQ